MTRYSLAGLRHDGRLPVEQARRREHFVFLVDTSGSMRTGGVAARFSEIHGELLDVLADGHPGALASLITFNEVPQVQYVGEPISVAPSLTMAAKFGTDFPVAVCDGLAPVIGQEGRADEDITAIIVTDGDFEAHTSRGHALNARMAIDGMRRRGVRFLLLVALSMELGPNPSTAVKDAVLGTVAGKASLVGIRRDEVMIWEHSADALSKAFEKVGDVLALGSSSGGSTDALPFHRL